MKENIKKGLNVASDILDVFKPIATVLAPKIAAPVILASEVLDNLVKADDETAKKVVFGLSATVLYLEELKNKFETKGEVDFSGLESVIENLKSIDSSLDKFYKLIS